MSFQEITFYWLIFKEQTSLLIFKGQIMRLLQGNHFYNYKNYLVSGPEKNWFFIKVRVCPENNIKNKILIIYLSDDKSANEFSSELKILLSLLKTATAKNI